MAFLSLCRNMELEMSRYQYDVSISRQRRFVRRFKKFLLVCLGLVMVAAIIVGLDGLRQETLVQTNTSKPVITAVQPSVREFNTPYFSFHSPTSWVSIPEQTTAHKFVYQGGNGRLKQQELAIYVVDPPTDLSGTHALPINIVNNNHIIPAEVTDHCNTASTLKKASQPVVVTIAGVTMQCKLDDMNYLVIVGQKNGDARVKLKRNDGTVIAYYFVYRSSSVPSDTQPLISIMSSFTSL